jgi:hypothetical protein
MRGLASLLLFAALAIPMGFAGAPSSGSEASGGAGAGHGLFLPLEWIPDHAFPAPTAADAVPPATRAPQRSGGTRAWWLLSVGPSVHAGPLVGDGSTRPEGAPTGARLLGLTTHAANAPPLPA